jgi:HEAT repeat protein
MRAVVLPRNLPPGAYDLAVWREGRRRVLPRVVHIRKDVPSRLRIAHLSDSHVGNLRRDWRSYNALAAIARDVEGKADLVVLSGDLTDFGIPTQFLRFRKALSAFRLPVFVCEGNHDHFDGGDLRFYRGRNAYGRYLGPRFYGFRIGTARFSVLGTGVYEVLPPGRMAWVSRMLAGEDVTCKALVFHADYTAGLAPGKGPVPAGQIGHLAADVGAHLALEGHLHRSRRRRLATAIALMTPAAKDGLYTLVEVEGGDVKVVTRREVEFPGRTPPVPAGAVSVLAEERVGLAGARALFRGVADAEALLTLLRAGKDWRVRALAARFLARREGPRQRRGPLTRALSDPHPFVREEAAFALGADTAVTPLKGALADPFPGVRLAAVKALGLVRGEAAVRALGRALRDPDPGVAWTAAAVLGTFRAEGMADTLGAALKDRTLAPRVRRRLVEALEAARGEGTASRLEAVLGDPEDSVRASAALALGRGRAWAAVPELIRLTEEGTDAQQAEAHRLLVRMARTDHGFGTAAARERWESWWDREGRRKAGR